MIFWRWFVASGFITLLMSGCDGAKSPGEIGRQAGESVVLINYEDKPGQGTGFIISGENKEVCTVLTVRHVVPPSAKLQLQTPDQKLWKGASITSIKRFPKQDLAVVTFKPDSGNCSYKTLRISNSDKVNLGDSIYITGFPGSSLAKQFATGMVSRIDSQSEGYGISYTAITAAGMSGGPVMNAAGEVVAVHGITDIELTGLAELKGEEPPPQQQSSTGINSSNGDAVGTFKWGIPINIYVANVAQVPTQVEATLKALDFSNQGNNFYIKQSYEDALASYDKAIALKPDYTDAWHNRGAALGELQRYEDALASFDKAIALKPDDANIWNNRGLALEKLQRYEDAVASYDKAIALKADYAEAWNNRGNALQDLQHYEDAIASYDKAIALKADYAEVWNNRGNALRKLQRYEDAIASYDKAIALKADDAAAWNNRGVALRNLQRYEDAIASYDKAIALKADDAAAWNNRGAALGHLQRYEDALASFDKAIAIKPNYAMAWDNRGIALEPLKRHDEALESYNTAIKFDPNNQEAINNRKDLLARLGRSK
ncbi:tetratricopeptide repeat-containing serine protease family protein [Coleofasciculus sp. FACHB-129]|uniref:tetratricopeptide repeat-containing S1 family peptidase n=1 Tax=Cyanophyceae TaxID=3028117 RepID=UPI0018EFDD6B|nr:tetratricopeptide repeat-containing serine protease family protein [Coleofasciculus sp. FACHB-129]